MLSRDFNMDEFAAGINEARTHWNSDSVEERAKSVSIEAMRLFVHQISEAQVAAGEGRFECMVVEYADWQNRIVPELAKMKVTEGQEVRMQFLVKNELHYGAVDICIGKDGCRAVIFDAAGDPKRHLLFYYLDKLQNPDGSKMFNAIYIPQQLNPAPKTKKFMQNTFHGCNFFALEFALQAAKDKRLYDFLAQVQVPVVDEQGKAVNTKHGIPVRWVDLPPEYVKNAQSVSWLMEQYIPALLQSGDPKVISHRFAGIDGVERTLLGHLEQTVNSMLHKRNAIIANQSIDKMFEFCLQAAESYLAQIKTSADIEALAGIASQPTFSAASYSAAVSTSIVAKDEKTSLASSSSSGTVMSAASSSASSSEMAAPRVSGMDLLMLKKLDSITQSAEYWRGASRMPGKQFPDGIVEMSEAFKRNPDYLTNQTQAARLINEIASIAGAKLDTSTGFAKVKQMALSDPIRRFYQTVVGLCSANQASREMAFVAIIRAANVVNATPASQVVSASSYPAAASAVAASSSSTSHDAAKDAAAPVYTQPGRK